jgi:hypothetical protein
MADEVSTWFVPEPRCPVHGQMREDLAADSWACAGWDGEGCGYRVRNEDLDWRYPGHLDLASFTRRNLRD